MRRSGVACVLRPIIRASRASVGTIGVPPGADRRPRVAILRAGKFYETITLGLPLQGNRSPGDLRALGRVGKRKSQAFQLPIGSREHCAAQAEGEQAGRNRHDDHGHQQLDQRETVGRHSIHSIQEPMSASVPSPPARPSAP